MILQQAFMESNIRRSGVRQQTLLICCVTLFPFWKYSQIPVLGHWFVSPVGFLLRVLGIVLELRMPKTSKNLLKPTAQLVGGKFLSRFGGLLAEMGWTSRIIECLVQSEAPEVPICRRASQSPEPGKCLSPVLFGLEGQRCQAQRECAKRF